MFDSNMHLLKIEDEGLNSPDDIIEQLNKKFNTMTKKEIRNELIHLSEKMTYNQIKKGLIYILDENWEQHDLFPMNFPNNIIPGVVIDPFSNNLDIQLDKLKESNIRFLKILPYEQHIFKEDYQEVVEFAKKVEERNMILTVCCAYGSRYLYKTNGVELVSSLLNEGIDSPIIMAHGGMLKVLDAMSLMLEFPNLYMDISFAISYWWDSRVLDDYAFALRKLNYQRVFYGSDYPYVDLETSLDYFQKFCEKYNLNSIEKNKVLHENFKIFLDKIVE
jgi:predicted TIM-barrel fold metal-dependent hydrolase